MRQKLEILLYLLALVLVLVIASAPPAHAAWTDDEWLAHIAMAEAEDEPLEGKALVICTVLNRVADSRFPDTVAEVTTQRGQFPVGNRLYLEPNADCWKALEMVRNSEVNGEGCLYFESLKGRWSWCEYIKTVGGHEFYR